MIFCFLGVLTSNKTFGQFANQYVFSASSGTYTPIAGTATSLVATADDAIATAVPIGFNFVYNNQTVTSFRAISNGVLSFMATGTQSAANNLATATATQRLSVAPLWDDLQCTSGVTYQLSGTAPNQVLTVQWQNMEWNYLSNTAVISFQVKIYETTNVVQFIYQQEATAYNPGTTGGASIGIMGSGTTDYISLTDVSASPVISTSASTNSLAAKPATGQIYTFTPPSAPATPSTPTQAAGPAVCNPGSELIVSGSPGTNETWYWQTSATGTSTATPHVAPYYVQNNGTYYLRAFNSVTGMWSAASSVVVSNFVFPAAPAPPTASQNPACVTTGSILSSVAAPAGENYFWQGTTALGTSTVNNATNTFNVATSGTYYVRAQDATTQCWSTTSGSLAVVINTYVPPAPVGNPQNNNICAGTPSQMLDVTTTSGTSTVSAASGTISLAIPDNNTTGVTSVLNIAGVPAGATVTNVSITFNATHTFDADLDISISGPNGVSIDLSSDNGSLNDNYVNTVFSNSAVTAITAGTAPFTGTFLPEGNLTNSFSIPNGAWTLKVVDDLGGDVGTVNNWSIVVTYIVPTPTITWYDAATAGTSLGTGTPFESVGTSVLPNTNTGGVYNFYAESTALGCSSTSRTLITVSITEVLAVLNPVNVTCNGGDNGSFTLGTVQCGSGNFVYSVDGFLPYGPIPTNLIAGTHTVVIQDVNTSGTSAPIVLVITEPAAPSALNATNVTYYNATLGWTTTGDEATWTVIYGPTGFDPATSGTVVPGVSNPHTLTGVLTESTSYDFYVFSDCGPVADTSGPLTFMTDSGFLAWDNQCGPGFTDISTTGTQVTGMTDDSESGLTLPWPWNVNGTIVNTITIGNNGGILFNTLTGNIAYTATGNGMFPYVQDLNTTLAGGGIYWQSNGVAPNRQFIIQWSNMPHFSTGTDGATFQILVDEATSDVYYFYNDVMMSNAAWNNGADAEIALITPNGTATVSTNSATYLTSNSCVHFYNALCPNVTLTSSLVYADEVIVDWNPGLYGETDWTVVYGLSGFDPAIPGEVIGSFPYNTSSADITGLTQNTSYDMYIYSECAADNITSDGFLYSFTTLPFCANPTTFAVGVDVDSLEATWNWTAYSTQYPISEYLIMYEMDGVYTNQVTAMGTNNADTVFDPMLIGSGVYTVYLQAVCTDIDNGGTDSSAWIGPITVVMPLSNDTVCGAENLEMDLVYTLNNVGATVSTDEINIAPPTTGAQETDGWANSTLNNTVWYSFVAPASGSVRINNTAINYNGQLAVYDVANCDDFNANFIMLGANDNEIGGTSLAPNFTVCGLTPGDTYYIMHDGSGTTGNYSISISEIVLEAGNAGGLTQICYGETVNLNTTISGNDAGGVWSSPVPTVNAGIIDSIFYSEGLSYQTFNFQYRMSDGCAYDSIVTQVQIFAPSSAGTDGTVTICKNGEVNLYTGLGGFVDMNGQWYDPSDNPTSSDITGSAFAGSFNYDYIAGNGVCPDDTANVVVIVLSTCDELSVEDAAFENVQLYPNPTSGIINIDADKAYNVEITDANGRIIKKGLSTSAGTTSIDLGKVQIGVYFVTLKNEGSSKVFRVVVQ